SPHLKSFTERIKVDGNEIEEENVVTFIRENKSYIEEISPSFFEITVAMAFQYFAREKVDFAIVEVGLGGRLDSTNIIKPELSLITNIGYDHMEFLGTTLQEIAAEKGGIIKKEVPVVISERQKETTNIFQTIAQKQNSPIYFADLFFSCERKMDLEKVSIYKNNDVLLDQIVFPLIGNHQLKNLSGVLTALEILSENNVVNINKIQLQKGIKNVLKNTGLKGRWQQLSDQPKTFCDVGHNEDGLSIILDQIDHYKYDNLIIVWGMVKDKEIKKVLSLLPVDAHYIFCQPQIPRGLDANELGKIAFSMGLNGEIEPSVTKAIQRAKAITYPQDFIFIGGSTFVVAEIEEL
ncbi:MAG: bifunctional folylpolyglutamate synthase/dihydrofolate synthase, partial [Flammeovirgaceae bacterium]|nr:bifunctional folylpolyglutamate synthase/dihydrofolate synthase [Flammeovirgaceae bacterium]